MLHVHSVRWVGVYFHVLGWTVNGLCHVFHSWWTFLKGITGDFFHFGFSLPSLWNSPLSYIGIDLLIFLPTFFFFLSSHSTFSSSPSVNILNLRFLISKAIWMFLYKRRLKFCSLASVTSLRIIYISAFLELFSVLFLSFLQLIFSLSFFGF